MASLVDKTKGFIVKKVANMEKPDAWLESVSVSHIDLGGATFLGHVGTYNSYRQALPICQISYVLKSANRQIASGTLPDPGSIKARGNTKIALSMKVPYDFLISVLRDTGRDWDIDYELEVGLTVDLPLAGSFTIPLKDSGECKLPKLANVF